MEHEQDRGKYEYKIEDPYRGEYTYEYEYGINCSRLPASRGNNRVESRTATMQFRPETPTTPNTISNPTKMMTTNPASNGVSVAPLAQSIPFYYGQQTSQILYVQPLRCGLFGMYRIIPGQQPKGAGAWAGLGAFCVSVLPPLLIIGLLSAILVFVILIYEKMP